MRTLILSCNTGGGHNACARAIQEFYHTQDAACDVADALRFISDRVSRLISGVHTCIYRCCPQLFGFGYRFSEQHEATFRQNSGAYRLLALGAERMYRFLCDGGYDCVICTHVFSALMLTEMLRRHPSPIATGFVATDYTCSPGTHDSRLDLYFIPDVGLTGEFAAPQLPICKLVPSGIPVRQMFCSRRSRCEARQALGLPEQHRHLVMMCGSIGCGPIRQLAAALAIRLDPTEELTIVCGTNQRLRRRLQTAHGHRANFHVLGYVEDISLLLDSADLYLTKPGGISVSEADANALPMVLIQAVAGCESYNRDFFLRRGGAVTAQAVSDLCQLCIELLRDPRQLAAMSVALGGDGCAARQIYNRMQALHRGRQTARSA